MLYVLNCNIADSRTLSTAAHVRRQVRLQARQLLALPANRYRLQLGQAADLRRKCGILRCAFMHIYRRTAEAPSTCAVPVLAMSSTALDTFMYSSCVLAWCRCAAVLRCIVC